MSPHARWTLMHFWPIPIILVGVLIMTATGQWLLAGTWLLWLVILIMNERGSRHSYMQGWWRGQVYQAEVMASDFPNDQKRQLLRLAIQPWDQMKAEGDHDG